MIYQKTTLLPCSLQEAFDFHCNISNMPKLSPPDTHVKLLKKPGEFKKDAVVELHAQKGYKSMHWIVQITDFNPPYSFTDVALKSPFKLWRHTHKFFEKEGQTYMSDIVELELPFGWFGKLFENYAKNELETMFAYRHKAVKELLYEDSVV